MSSYKNLIISALLSINLYANDNKLSKQDLNLYENQYIIFALEYEKSAYFKEAKELYKRLTQISSSNEYLYKYLEMCFRTQDFNTIINVVEAKKLKDSEFLELYAISLSENGKYLKAVKIFEEIFSKTKNEQVLLNIVNIYVSRLDDKNTAKEILEKYIHENLESKLSLNLLFMYEKDKEYDKAISLLNKMYIKFKDKDELFYEKTRKLLMSYYYNFSPKEGIVFFKEHENDNIDIIITLYKELGDLKEVYTYLNKGFSQTNNLNYLAQIAMYDYETAENKESILNDVILKFEKVLKEHGNPVYQNYLAYLLIDHDVNINKGVDLVKKALEKHPEDIAFLDTLAWGVFKQNQCQRAYDIMKNIVDKIGLNDKEIKIHWEKIKECNK